MSNSDLSPADYGGILGSYLRTHSEEALYQASRLSQICIESGLGPEDIIALHFEALDPLLNSLPYREQARANGDAQQFLLEVMIAYGVKYKEYLELKLSQSLHDADSRAVRERERATEAERLQREKDEILAVIAHELRTPITAAKGNIELAYRVLRRGEYEPVPRLLGSAREAIERLSRLSADLVEASRGRAPRIELAPLDLGSAIVQACDWAQPAAASKGVTLTYEHEGMPLTVHANSDALLSVFGNLLSNSVRYTAPGGWVRVTSGRSGAEAWVAVRDNGIGMAPDVRARVFEKFYRGPEARIMEATGLGLGLALVQQMIDALGGRVELDSTEGQGSTFQVILPLYTHEDEEIPNDGSANAGPTGIDHHAPTSDH
ncbi:MAG TPA: HAMP domain-containing sensor histidine kinase [Chloroflexota bacterium]|nr:HAMP domain-containing sensor histidine kinase [Chloroflexota bacterium]